MANSNSTPAENLTKIMGDVQAVSQQVYKTFTISQQFVNGIDDYIRYKRAQGIVAKSLGPEWRSFTNVRWNNMWTPLEG